MSDLSEIVHNVSVTVLQTPAFQNMGRAWTCCSSSERPPTSLRCDMETQTEPGVGDSNGTTRAATASVVSSSMTVSGDACDTEASMVAAARAGWSQALQNQVTALHAECELRKVFFFHRLLNNSECASNLKKSEKH